MVLAPNGNEMHYTYASHGSAEFYRKNKWFADGTVLVKEVFATTHAQLTTGDAKTCRSSSQGNPRSATENAHLLPQ
jgi:hypothetical protein